MECLKSTNAVCCFQLIWSTCIFIRIVVDLFSILLSVNPVCVHAWSLYHSDLGTLHSFRQQVALIQRDSVWWLHTIVPKIIEVKLSEYVHWWVHFLTTYKCSFDSLHVNIFKITFYIVLLLDIKGQCFSYT